MEENLSSGNFIFRYRTLNVDNLNAFANDYLWFSNFYSQNDPFDGVTEYEWDRRDDGLLLQELVNLFPDMDEAEALKFLELSKQVSPYYSDKNPVLITCFSRKYDELLLWSHYANGHRGFCQVFCSDDSHGRPLLEILPDSIVSSREKLVVNDRYLPLLPVSYQDTKGAPLLSSLLNTDFGMKKRVDDTRIKFTSWQYEAEVRCAVFENSLRVPNKVFYPIETIYGIILGSEISEDSEKMLTAICREKKIHLYKMKKVFGKFAIQEQQMF